MERSQCCCHNGLDGVHAVLCLIKDQRLCALKDLVGDFHCTQTVFLTDLFADDGVQIVEGGETVEEDGILSGFRH